MLKPTQDWILTKPLESSEKVTKSGLILPSNTKEAVKLVKLVSFGPRANKQSVLEKDYTVMVQNHTGIKIKHEDEEYELHREHNFLGVVE